MNDDSSTKTWVADLFQRPLDVNRRKEGDEWVDHLFAALHEEVPAGGRSAKGREAAEGVPCPHLEYTVASDQLTSALRLIPLENGIYVLVTGEGDTPSAAEINPWSRATHAATERVGRLHKDFRWSAVIGPLPGLQLAGQVLEEHAEVGGLSLRSGGVLHQEPMRSGLPSFHGHGWFWSSPVIVSGSSRGYNWSPASVSAARDLHRLCALLSVAWDSAWGVREAPAPEEMGERTIPERPPFYNDDQSDGDTTTWVRTPVAVPEWAAAAWDLIENAEILADALVAHRQGLVLQEEHPSFALIAFVAGIEGIGTKLSGSKVGSGERFRGALRLVLPEEEARSLAKSYDPRSRTVHGRKLHGTEARVGAIAFPGFLTEDAVNDFEMGTLYKMRRASRKLLLLGVTGLLTTKA